MTPALLADLAGLLMVESDATLTQGAEHGQDATDEDIAEAKRLDDIALDLLGRVTATG